MRILVTGATGFIGRGLCSRLLAEGHDVRRAVRHSSTNANSEAVGDIGLDTSWAQALSGVGTVIHLAARVHIMDEDADDALAEFRRINVDGTLTLARQAAAKGVKRFVYLSTIKVNGEETQSGHPFTENSAPAPEDSYAISKFEAEKGLLLLAQETDLEMVIIRPPLVYGPGVKGNFASMMHWINKGVPLPFGSIHNQRNLIALDNLVDFIIVCVDHPAAPNQIFLISDGQDLSTTELLRYVGQAMGRPARLIPVSVKMLKLGAAILGKQAMIQRLCSNLQVDITKAQEVLGWMPPVGVEEGLRRTVVNVEYLSHTKE